MSEENKNSRAANIKQLFSNDRQRLVLLLTVGIVGAMTIGGMVMMKSDTKNADSQANVSLGQAPNVSTTAGVTKNQRYAEIQARENEARAEKAKDAGTSMILTPVALQGDPSKAQPQPQTAAPATAQTKPAQPVQQTPVQPANTQSAPQAPQRDPQLVAAEQRRVAMVSAGMQRQMESLLNRWSSEGSQVLEFDNTARSAPAPSSSSSPASASSSSSAASSAQTQQVEKKVLMKAGEIAYAVLKTSVNSDQPGPVLADIVAGKFAGGRILGSLTRSEDKVVLQFTSMSLPTANSSMSIAAYAVDPETSRTGLATDADHHYIQRFGLLFASAFVKGYGQAAQQAAQTQTVSGSGVVTTSRPEMTTSQIMAGAWGEVGNQAAQVFSQNAQRPITVVVDAGTPIGVLFTQDVQVK